MDGRAIRVAFRVGVFGALGAVVAELVNGHARDSGSLALFAVEVWAIVCVLWLVLEALRGRR